MRSTLVFMILGTKPPHGYSCKTVASFGYSCKAVASFGYLAPKQTTLRVHSVTMSFILGIIRQPLECR